MVVKNTLLGGTDFSTPSDRVKPTDLNDTFDSAAGFLNWCGSNFNDIAQNIFNADYIGFDSRLNNNATPQYNNVFYSTFTADESTSLINMGHDATNDLFTNDLTFVDSGFSIYDDFDGPSLDGAKWSFSASGSIPANGLIVNGNLTVRSNDSSFDSYDGAVTGLQDIFTEADDWIKITFSTFSTQLTGGQDADCFLELIGDTTTTLLTVNSGGSSADKNGTSVYIEKVGDTIYYYDDLSNTWNSVSISGWGATPKLRFRTNASSSGGIATITTSAIQYLTNKNIHTYIGKDNPTSETVTNLIPITNQTIDSNSTVANSVAADGTNFETITLQEMHRPSITGSQINNKVVMTSDNTIANKDQLSTISEEAIKYNML